MKTLFFKKGIVSRLVFVLVGLFCLSAYVSSAMALVLGFLVAIIVANPFVQRTDFYIHWLLKIAIIGLGFGLNLNEALQAGKSGFFLTIFSIILVLVLGYLLGRWLRVDTALSYLISVGTAICGGSAIASISPIIKPSSKQISVALGVVFSLNALALFVFPMVGHWLGLTQQEFGLWCAIGIHDTSSVVGAASKYGDEALKIATIVKLARALWIIPVCLVTMFLMRKKSSRIKIPWFIGFFILAIIINTYLPLPVTFSEKITYLSKSVLHLTLFLIGTTLSVDKLKTIGLKPLLLAIILWICSSIGGLLVIIG